MNTSERITPRFQPKCTAKHLCAGPGYLGPNIIARKPNVADALIATSSRVRLAEATGVALLLGVVREAVVTIIYAGKAASYEPLFIPQCYGLLGHWAAHGVAVNAGSVPEVLGFCINVKFIIYMDDVTEPVTGGGDSVSWPFK
ncbi:hypothetical protein CEXT_49161 [Caerostris extrusa]|uniref:Uncharacterized protein n=1 Tax=Caerostris extrusa TaxID=172846 RepID=A0AAV4XV38_CAEEX|nr:hypothetical protein CEXT_49161 [Caerostris extrusa]